MSAPFSTRPSRPAHRFRPALELLSDRVVPAATVTQSGGTLTVVGTSGADLVIITDNGGTGDRSVVVQTPGRIFFSHGTVRSIRVTTGDGNDRVTYSMEANMAAGSTRKLFFDLGPGALDRLRLGLNGDVTAGSLLAIQVEGGSGRDRVLVDSSNDIDVAPGANLNIRVNGGSDQDRLAVHFQGEVDGHVSLAADGGQWLDQVLVEVTADPGSTGRVTARSRGGPDDDRVDLIASLSVNDPVTFSFLADGGPGQDRGKHTSLVTTVGIERSQQVG